MDGSHYQSLCPLFLLRTFTRDLSSESTNMPKQLLLYLIACCVITEVSSAAEEKMPTLKNILRWMK